MAFTLVIPDVSLLGHEWQELAALGLIVDGPSSTRKSRSTSREQPFNVGMQPRRAEARESREQSGAFDY